MKNKFNYNNFDFENSKDLNDFLELKKFQEAFSSSMGGYNSKQKTKFSNEPFFLLRELLVSKKQKALLLGQYDVYDALKILIDQYDIGLIGFEWDALNQNIKIKYFEKN
jgi:hypothetical protein